MGNGKRKSAAEVQVIFIFIHQGSSLSLQTELHENIRWWVGSACYSQLRASQSPRCTEVPEAAAGLWWNNPFLETGKIHLKGWGTRGICRMSRSRSYNVYHKAETFSSVGVRPVTFGWIRISDLILDLLNLYSSPSAPYSPTKTHKSHHKYFIF